MLSVLLFSSLGVTADYHYCRGEIKNVSLIGEAQSCHKGKSDDIPDPNTAKSCCKILKSSWEQFSPLENLPAITDHKECCNNELRYHHLDIDTNISFAGTIHISSVQYFLMPHERYLVYFSNFTIQNLSPEKYIPPLLERSIILLFQNFLL